MPMHLAAPSPRRKAACGCCPPVVRHHLCRHPCHHSDSRRNYFFPATRGVIFMALVLMFRVRNRRIGLTLINILGSSDNKRRAGLSHYSQARLF